MNHDTSLWLHGGCLAYVANPTLRPEGTYLITRSVPLWSSSMASGYDLATDIIGYIIVFLDVYRI